MSARIRAKRAARARKEVEEADKDKGSKRTISFGAGNSNSKTVTPLKSALKKGPKETIKVFKCELVVDMRVRINYTSKKNEVRKQVCNYLGGILGFILEMLLEGKAEVAFLGKEGRKPQANPIKTTADFPTKAFGLTQKYASVSNPYAFSNGRQGNSKTVNLCMVMGMDEDIKLMLEKWKMDLSERGVEIRKKPGQEVHRLTNLWCWERQQVCLRLWWKDNSRRLLQRQKTE